MPTILDFIRSNPTQTIIDQLREMVGQRISSFSSEGAQNIFNSALRPANTIISASNRNVSPVAEDLAASTDTTTNKAKSKFPNLSDATTEELQRMLSGETLQSLGLPNKFADPDRPVRSKRRLKRATAYPSPNDTLHGYLSAVALEGTPERQAVQGILEQRLSAQKSAEEERINSARRQEEVDRILHEAFPSAQGVPSYFAVPGPRKPVENPGEFNPFPLARLKELGYSSQDLEALLNLGKFPRTQSLEEGKFSETQSENDRVQQERLFRRQFDLAKLDLDRAQIQAKYSEIGSNNQRLSLELKKYGDERTKSWISAGVPARAATLMGTLEANLPADKLLSHPLYPALRDAADAITDVSASYDSKFGVLKSLTDTLKNNKDVLDDPTLEALQSLTNTVTQSLGESAHAQFGSALEKMQIGLNPAFLIKDRVDPKTWKSIAPFFNQGWSNAVDAQKQTPSSSSPNVPPLLGQTGSSIREGASAIGSGLKGIGSLLSTIPSTEIRRTFGSLPKTKSEAEKFYNVSLPDNWESLPDLLKADAINHASFQAGFVGVGAPPQLVPQKKKK